MTVDLMEAGGDPQPLAQLCQTEQYAVWREELQIHVQARHSARQEKQSVSRKVLSTTKIEM